MTSQRDLTLSLKEKNKNRNTNALTYSHPKIKGVSIPVRTAEAYVKKYGTGVVCVKKDKDAGFNLKTYVFPSKSMGESILEVFSKTKKQNN